MNGHLSNDLFLLVCRRFLTRAVVGPNSMCCRYRVTSNSSNLLFSPDIRDILI